METQELSRKSSAAVVVDSLAPQTSPNTLQIKSPSVAETLEQIRSLSRIIKSKLAT